MGSVSPGAHSQKTDNMPLAGCRKKLWYYKKICSVLSQWYHSWSNVLEWISPYYNRKIYTGQTSLWDFFDARQIARILSVALRMPSMNRSCTFELTLPQQFQNLPGLFGRMWIWTHICNSSKFSIMFILFVMNFRDPFSTLSKNFYPLNPGTFAMTRGSPFCDEICSTMGQLWA